MNPSLLTDQIMKAIAEDIQCGVMLSGARVRAKVLAILQAEASPAPQRDTVTISRYVYGDLLYAQGELASIEALVSERGEIGTYAQVEAAIREARPAPSPALAESSRATLERLAANVRRYIPDNSPASDALNELRAALRAAPSPVLEIERAVRLICGNGFEEGVAILKRLSGMDTAADELLARTGSVRLDDLPREDRAFEAQGSTSSPTEAAKDENRCAVCGWSLVAQPKHGCSRGNCSMRPIPRQFYDPERAAREAK